MKINDLFQEFDREVGVVTHTKKTWKKRRRMLDTTCFLQPQHPLYLSLVRLGLYNNKLPED